MEARTPALDGQVASAQARELGWRGLGDQWRSRGGCSRRYVVRRIAHGHILKAAALGDWSGSAGWWSSETAGERNLLGAGSATYCDAGSKAISDAQLV
jgi:hypothetical protein